MNAASNNQKLLEKYIQELNIQGYSIKTKKNYISHIHLFQEYINKNLDDILEKDVKAYLDYLLMEKGCSHSFANQAISSIKFLNKYVIHQQRLMIFVNRPRKEKKLPNVLSKEEVKRILASLDNKKHTTILALIYSSGLRVSEVTKMRIKDIDSDRMLIKVKQGKGKKDRYVMLSEKILVQLREYYREYKPKQWLFEGSIENSPITERTVQKIFKNACVKAKVNKEVSVHSLRHSVATHLLESGVDIRYIQQLLGHSSIKTTEIYTHITNKNIADIRSPLDNIMEN